MWDRLRVWLIIAVCIAGFLWMYYAFWVVAQNLPPEPTLHVPSDLLPY